MPEMSVGGEPYRQFKLIRCVGNFTKALAKEVATRNITVNIVAPGFIETDMTRALAPATRDIYLSQIPIGKFGSAEDVAHAVLFLSSREAGYMTGQTLHVNGGMYMG